MIAVIKLKGFNSFRNALKQSPQMVRTETRNFLTRTMSLYKSTIWNSPWRVGGSGGGSPVAPPPIGGTLRASHKTTFSDFMATLAPNTSYMVYVHEGTSKMRARPWLEYAIEDNKTKVERLADDFRQRIIRKLT